MLKRANNAYVITGAGISTSADIPDLEHLSSSIDISSETALKNDPQQYYAEFHKLFIDPVFENGPTDSHRFLAKLEEDDLIKGIVTTNIDFLHELAGSKNVADIWSNLNRNHYLKCGRIFPIETLKSAVPTCPICGGLLIPDPVYRHIGIDENAYLRANQWMKQADLVITIGSNGYYDNIPNDINVININPKRNHFDQRAQLTIHSKSDLVFDQIYDYL
ncbi:hypothetical protein IV57_GL001334 [Companilactobacillus kimchiensis]|uniref:protein acetyllysine N-acetyltransferase n=2 Tax=Companilactobacillus kimchiensis TaxID=993692 RepID=A0A0R2LGS8_9LACO|nr:hypothetical protein IV57_GL001334 [Companilactobacillus kimchiensis]